MSAATRLRSRESGVGIFVPPQARCARLTTFLTRPQNFLSWHITAETRFSAKSARVNAGATRLKPVVPGLGKNFPVKD
jgi:hypothetical protein